MHWTEKIKASKAAGIDAAADAFAAHAAARGMGYTVKGMVEVLKADGCYDYEEPESAAVIKLYNLWWKKLPRPIKKRELLFLPGAIDKKLTEALDVLERSLILKNEPDAGPVVIARVRETDTAVAVAYVDVTQWHPILMPPYLVLARHTDTRYVLIKQEAGLFFSQFNTHGG